MTGAASGCWTALQGRNGIASLSSDFEIIEAYRWLLGRVPSEEEASALRNGPSGTPALAALRGALLASPEFRAGRIRAHLLARERPVELADDRIVFLHIPKCGGTTLHGMLASQVSPERICPERDDALGDWTINELAAYRLFSGHYNLPCCGSIPGRVRIVTMLREPKARLLSLFHFWKAHVPHPDRDADDLLPLARALSAEAFFSHPAVVRHARIRDASVGQLTRTTTGRLLDPDEPVMRAPAAALAAAWSALQHLAGFGIMERFGPSRLLLNAALGLDMQPVASLQVLETVVQTNPELVPVEIAPMTDRLDRLLDGLTTLDRPLYAHALQLFSQRIRTGGQRTRFGRAADRLRGPPTPARLPADIS